MSGLAGRPAARRHRGWTSTVVPAPSGPTMRPSTYPGERRPRPAAPGRARPVNSRSSRAGEVERMRRPGWRSAERTAGAGERALCSEGEGGSKSRRLYSSRAFSGRAPGPTRLDAHGLAGLLQGADPPNALLRSEMPGRPRAKPERLSGEPDRSNPVGDGVTKPSSPGVAAGRLLGTRHYEARAARCHHARPGSGGQPPSEAE
jgi:hypothetical protein